MMELVEVLSRPKIQQKYQIHSDGITELITLVRLRGELVLLIGRLMYVEIQKIIASLKQLLREMPKLLYLGMLIFWI